MFIHTQSLTDDEAVVRWFETMSNALNHKFLCEWQMDYIKSLDRDNDWSNYIGLSTRKELLNHAQERIFRLESYRTYCSIMILHFAIAENGFADYPCL